MQLMVIQCHRHCEKCAGGSGLVLLIPLSAETFTFLLHVDFRVFDFIWTTQ